MPSILEQLPDLADLDGVLNVTLGRFGTLSVKVEGFAPADLDAVLAAGDLPVPGALALVEGTLETLSRMAEALPTDPQALTAEVQAGLGRLLTDATGIAALLGPLGDLVEFVAPLLDQFQLLADAVQRINALITALPGALNDLDMADPRAPFEALSRLFDLLPETAGVGPFQDLRAQVETLIAWLTLGPAELTEHFRVRIQVLADALPVQLDAALQVGLARVAAIEAPLAGLGHDAWCAPYAAALDAVASIDLADPGQVAASLALLDAQVAQVAAVATALTADAQAVADAVDQLDADRIGQDLRAALSSILLAIAPEKPGVLAVLLARIQKGLGGLDFGLAKDSLALLEQRVDALLGALDTSALTTTIAETTDRLVETVGAVDRALVQVATTLSNLVTELQGPIASLDLPGLVGQVQAALGQLRTTVGDVATQVATVRQQVEGFVTDVGDDVDALDLAAVKDAIGGLLTHITGVLKDPAVAQALEGIRQGIDAIVGQLEGVSLTPVFDQVIGEIDKAKAQVAAIDLSQLNDVLKAALAVALEVIRDVDFAGDIADALTADFQVIFDQGGNLLQPVQEAAQQIRDRIGQFDPGALVAAQLAPPFEALVAALSAIQPSKVLEPLEDLHAALLARLQPLDPALLLEPLADLHGRLVAALQSLSPHDLIAPLNTLLAEVTGVLEELKIEELITKVTGAVTKFDTLMDQFLLGDQIRGLDFWGPLGQVQGGVADVLQGMEARVDAFLDRMVAAIPGVDMAGLQPALDALDASITLIEGQVAAPAVVTQLGQVAATLAAQDVPGCVTALTQRWSAQKARFAAAAPPPGLASAYAMLVQQVQELSPIVRLATPATLAGRVRDDLAGALLVLSRAQEALARLLAADHDHLEALLPAAPTAAGFRRLLRAALEDQIGRPLKDLLGTVRARLAVFNEALQALGAIAMKFRGPSELLMILPESIGQVGDALIHAKDRITGVNLEFLEDELQGVLDQTLAQLAALGPATILPDLRASFQATLQALEGLYPEAAIQALDTTYRDVILKKLEDLDPAQTVAEPLNAQFQEILQLLDTLGVDEIFVTLTGKLEGLGLELEDGLDRTARAFNELLAALPSAASLAVSVDIGIG